MNFKADLFDKFMYENGQNPKWVVMGDEYDTAFIKTYEDHGLLLLIQFNNTPFVRCRVLVSEAVDVNTEGLLNLLNRLTSKHDTFAFVVTEDKELCATFTFSIEDADFDISFFCGYLAYNIQEMIPDMVEILDFLNREVPEGIRKKGDSVSSDASAANEDSSLS